MSKGVLFNGEEKVGILIPPQPAVLGVVFRGRAGCDGICLVLVRKIESWMHKNAGIFLRRGVGLLWGQQHKIRITAKWTWTRQECYGVFRDQDHFGEL